MIFGIWSPEPPPCERRRIRVATATALSAAAAPATYAQVFIRPYSLYTLLPPAPALWEALSKMRFTNVSSSIGLNGLVR